MIKFELIKDNKYKLNNNIISAEDLSKMILNGTIESILSFNNNNDKAFCIDTKIDLINKPKNTPISSIQKIYFGSPGTGKSYCITKELKKYYEHYNEKCNTSKNIFRTTVHSEYTYYDFVGNILPISENGNITYEFVPGIFTNALFRSYQTEDPVFLVLEEMSRGNIASIFGDLFQLLDRDKKGNSDYSVNNSIISEFILKELKNNSKIKIDKNVESMIENKTIFLPKNLHILGSINTSDQNVFVIDTAFKRRFSMHYISLDPVYDENNNPLNNIDFSIGSYESTWCEFYPKLNKFIVEVMGHSEDKQLGQFFLKFKNEQDYNLTNIDNDIKNEILDHINAWNKEQIIDKLLLYLWQDIECSSFSGKKLFNNINCFSELFFKSENKDVQVFSNDFLQMLESN